jgi:DNA-binding CsgD family transcriptional regulator
MPLSLSSEDHSRLVATATALLSPLQFASREEWYRAVGVRLEDLLDGDATMVVVAGPLEVTHTSVTAPELAASFDAHARVEAGQLRSDVSALDRGISHARRIVSSSFTSTLFDRMSGGGFLRSAYYNEVIVPLGVRGNLGWFRSSPTGFTHLGAYSARADPEPSRFGEDTLAVLDLLLPAFEAGIEMVQRMEAGRGAMIAAFDRDRDAVLVWDPHQGRELYRNRCFSQLTACDPGGPPLAAAMTRFAQRWSVASLGRQVPEVDTHHGWYRLSASHLPAGLFGRDEVLIVAAQRIDPALPTARQLAVVWGLSSREAEVVLALARGQTDVSIARTLGISPHTVRHHAEHIFAKLGIRSRKAIGMRLLETAHVQDASGKSR